jgi:hypothetical protein
MPSFKPKANRNIKVDEKSLITLDSKHQEMLSNIRDRQQIRLPKLKKQKKRLLREIKTLSDDNVERRLEISDTLGSLSKEIRKIRNEERKYLLDNSAYIFSYFEKKKEISGGGANKTRVLNSFFNKTEMSNKESISSNVQSYLTNVDKRFFNITNFMKSYEVCICGGEMIPIEHEGVRVCNNCGQQEMHLVEHEKPSYKEPPKEACFYAYRRINHFREILAQFQAKETTQIPEKVLSDIKAQIIKERLSLSQLTNKKSKDILKKLGHNKYYEHIPFIKDKLGIKPPVMAPELEERLCNLFTEVEKQYAKHCPNDRVNFLNYYYVLYKMCELLNERRFLTYFPMLKDPVKRIEQDIIWKKICQELDWTFIPTV